MGQREDPSFKNSLKHLMNCVLDGEIVYIKEELLSLSLSLCLNPHSIPSSFCSPTFLLGKPRSTMQGPLHWGSLISAIRNTLTPANTKQIIGGRWHGSHKPWESHCAETEILWSQQQVWVSSCLPFRWSLHFHPQNPSASLHVVESVTMSDALFQSFLMLLLVDIKVVSSLYP